MEHQYQQKSTQLEMTQKVYIANMAPIGDRILALAEAALLDDHLMTNIIGGDALWTPFHEVSPELNDYCGEHGNEDDETEYLASVWLNVLLNAPEPARFLDMMRRMSDVQVNGL